MLAVTDSAFVAGVIGAVLITGLLLNRSITGKLGTMQVTLGSVDRSTNHRGKGQPTLSEEVSTIATNVAELATSVDQHRARFEEVVTDQLTPRVTSIEGTVAELAARVRLLEHPTPPPTPTTTKEEAA
jgi:hypothetical protein